MVIGFLGKGGSGKSTLSYYYSRHLKSNGFEVLAIDADHNMDLAHRFGDVTKMPHYGSSMEYLRELIGLSAEENYKKAFQLVPNPEFYFGESQDPFTKKYTYVHGDGTLVMTPGPHTNEVVLGKWCSHSLFTALKVYLSFLELSDFQRVVVDEKAGADGADIGTSSSFDVSVIVAEPTPYGVKAAKQISEILDRFDAPYVFVGNKVYDQEDIEFLKSHLGELATVFYVSKFMARSDHESDAAENVKAIKELHKAVENSRPTLTRLERTREKLSSKEPVSL
jgi:CO dehydrogenase maturation factor